MMRAILSLTLAIGLTGFLTAEVDGWLHWRGPLQNGSSLEKNLPTDLSPGKELWTYDIMGGGTPVIADGRLYAFGFYGERGQEVREALLCLDANSGEKLWEKRFSDYLSDVIYNRYAIGAPTVDPETGNVYLQLTNGRCVAFTRDGEPLWEVSLMEELGRLTFPNGRTGAPAVFEHLVIFHCVTVNWGRNGPAQDRFYAFDKTSGELVWYSSPGTRPVDSAFNTPVFGKLDGRDVFYAGTGCGNIVCVNARTGEPVWRYELSQGGVNAQVILTENHQLIAVHGKENLNSTTKGSMICLNVPQKYPDEQLVLGADALAWRNEDPVSFTSSPVRVEGNLYITTAIGELLCIDLVSGKTHWRKKLAPDQLHASPTAADGKLYVPMFDGAVYVLEPGDDGAKTLFKHEFEETCLGAPAIYGGKVYLLTKGKLHCWGAADGTFVGPKDPPEKPSPGPIADLQIVPAEFALTPGESVTFKIYGLDAHGRRVKTITPDKWETFIPPSAKVKAQVDASFEGNTLTAPADAKLSAGAFKATHGKLSATTRGRVIAGRGYREDFDDIKLVIDGPDGQKVNFPPLPWLGARIKWQVSEKDGSQVLTKRLDNVLFQRTTNFIGDPEMSGYTLSADVMTDGNRRIMSSIGLVNQRYLIALVGNSQVLEVSSNYDRLSESVPFTVKPNTWYRLKTKVETNPDGSGTVMAKAWPRAENEPSDWTLSVDLGYCHPKGAPGIYGFTPQSLKTVFIDNIAID